MNHSLHRPKVISVNSPSEAAEKTSNMIAEMLVATPRITLGLATGSTPIPVYQDLVQRHRDGTLSFAEATSFNLDEYLGLAGDHPQSFRAFMDEHLFRLVDMNVSRIHIPDGLATDLDAHTKAYEKAIAAAGGIDIQLLGIGSNGHIAFNEPGSSRTSRTRVVELTSDTIQANSRFFDRAEDVPRQAISMGIGTILEAKRIVLLATGPAKAQAVKDAVQGDANESCPASLLQYHPDVTFVLDAEASSLLQ
ncbi:glucosamine-6-phosphate deaminase [Rubripirellula amarantea]|nr:glucosamine-6-phosphate deaminase [Rubripirellula amarantea]